MKEENQLNSATISNNEYDEKFVSINVINLSSCYLKCIQNPKNINKAKINEEIEEIEVLVGRLGQYDIFVLTTKS